MNKEKPDPIISETLDVIRKALESENHDNIFEKLNLESKDISSYFLYIYLKYQEDYYLAIF